MIHIILGTKAQLIKMAPVMIALKTAGLPYRLIFTGQHQETIDDILGNFGIGKPDYQLYSGGDITSIPAMALWSVRILWRTLVRRQDIFGDGKHGIVLVHGDTFSTLLGALMAKSAGFKVGHVESGLRSFNLFHPFPEEIIRLLTLRLADYLFCPNDWAMANVANYSGIKINTGGNTLADALRLALSAPGIPDLNIPNTPFAIVTLHRFENIFSRTALERIVRLVEHISQTWHLLFILHKPTEKKLRDFGLYERLASIGNIELRQRYDFFRFVKLIGAAEFIVSDGGSNQEECFYLGKPVLLLRQATERTEGLGGNCVLSGYDPNIIDSFVSRIQNYRRAPFTPDQSPSQIIADTCRQFVEPCFQNKKPD